MSTEKQFPDPMEAATPEQWAAEQDRIVRQTVTFAAAGAPEVAARLERADVEPREIRGVADLARIPVLSKDDLPALQAQSPPFGGMLSVPVEKLRRVYQSPGPILDPEGDEPDFWRFEAAVRACGLGPGDIVYNTFSYHLTPAGMMIDEGLRAAGCTVIPGGVGNSEHQAELMSKIGATGYTGTPDFLHTLVELAAAKGWPLKLERAFVSGGPLPAALRATLEGDHGLLVYEGYGTADAGALGYECDRHDGWHVSPAVVTEIVDPASGRPLDPGDTGEVVVTVPSAVYPLVRFGTGDLSALDAEPCACGRTTPRLLGWQGRVGDGVKVRGMFVHGRQLAAACERLAAARFQAVVSHDQARKDRLTVRFEGDAADLDPAELAGALRAALKLRAEVEIVEPGTIAEDAAVLVDERTWE